MVSPGIGFVFVGRATTKKLLNLGIMTIGELAKTDPVWLKTVLKKQGEIVWNFANGIDFHRSCLWHRLIRDMVTAQRHLMM